MGCPPDAMQTDLALATDDAPPRKLYVAVAGNIGAGKSTLTQILADTFRWSPFFESVDDNPYLSDFYEDVEIFARNLFDMGLMDGRDYENYVELFSIMVESLRPPDLLVYLRANVPTLVSHIQARGREFESSIRLDYLERLNGLYEDWIDRYPHPKLVIETDDLDFVNEDEDRYEILSRIESRLFGLFPVEG